MVAACRTIAGEIFCFGIGVTADEMLSSSSVVTP
jgi:hypothetical protein